MSKFLSLMKASMSEGMSVFNFKLKTGGKAKKIAVFGFLLVVLMISIYSYADMMLEPLAGTGMEYSVLTIFALIAVVFILVEGLYKASGLLFNCRDDDLVLALPVRRSSVFLMRIAKFYSFELFFSALILAPAMVAYVVRVGVGAVEASFYLSSLVALVLLPVIPVVLASLIAMGISGVASRFKFKNLIQIVLTTVMLVGILALSFNIQNIMLSIAEHASSVNEVISRLYYPVGAYIQMVTDFNVLGLLVFIVANVAVAGVFVWALSKVYFKINSRAKVVKVDGDRKESTIKARSVMASLMIKEARRFVTSPVFLINAGFSLVLYVIAVVMVVVNVDGLVSMLGTMLPAEAGITGEMILGLMPVATVGLIVFCALMTSITSSMISLEGRTINILKSMPVSAFKIILAKVLTAVVIIVPFFLIGDIILFIKFDYNVWQMLMIVALSIVMPIVAETLGIIVNLKFPKMDAENDTEVVKQSMSSMVAVFAGLILGGVTIYMMYVLVSGGVAESMVMLVVLAVYTLVMAGLVGYLKLKGKEEFNRISV